MFFLSRTLAAFILMRKAVLLCWLVMEAFCSMIILVYIMVA